MRGGNPRLTKLRDDCEFYPTAELPVAGTVFSELPGSLVSVISISDEQGLLLMGGTNERLLTPGTVFPGLPRVLAGSPCAAIPGSGRRALLGLTNAVLHVGGDLCCLSCTHLPGLSFHQCPLKQQIWHLPNRWFGALCVWCSRFIFRYINKLNFFSAV